MRILMWAGAVTAALAVFGCAEVFAQSEYGWNEDGIVDSNHYQVPRSMSRNLAGRSPFRATANSAGSEDSGLRRHSDLGTSGTTREWFRLPPRTFYQRDLLGSAGFYGSTPLNYGQGYGTGFGPNYFGNFGNGYGTGESRSYFGNYGIGYGVGASRKY